MKTTDTISFQNACDIIKTEEIRKSETFINEINSHDYIKKENFFVDESNKLKSK